MWHTLLVVHTSLKGSYLALGEHCDVRGKLDFLGLPMKDNLFWSQVSHLSLQLLNYDSAEGDEDFMEKF